MGGGAIQSFVFLIETKRQKMLFSLKEQKNKKKYKDYFTW